MSARSLEERAQDPLDDIATQLRTGVEIKDRKYRFSTYQKCFVGRDAVDFMVRDGLASTREEAVQLGQSIMTELSLFEHVTRDHQFKGELLFTCMRFGRVRCALTLTTYLPPRCNMLLALLPPNISADDYLFYHFVDTGDVSIDQATGEFG